MGIITMTPEEAKSIVKDMHPQWEVVDVYVEETGTFSLFLEGIFRNIATGKIYRLNWSEPLSGVREPFAQSRSVEAVPVREVNGTWVARL